MATVVIGGETIKVSLPNFVKLEAAWVFIEKVMTEPDPMKGVRAILGVVAVGAADDQSDPEQLTPEALAPTIAIYAKKLKPSEAPELRGFINPLLIEIGLAKPPEERPGEATPAEGAAIPSTATSAA